MLERGVGTFATRREDPKLEPRRASGERSEAIAPDLLLCVGDAGGVEAFCCMCRPKTAANSSSFPGRDKADGRGVDASSSAAFARLNASNTGPTWERYSRKADGSTCGIGVSVTAGMSRVDGGLCPEGAGREECGTRPVRTIVGESRVDIAFCGL